MKRWFNSVNDYRESNTIDEFLEEIKAVCLKYGFSISHEDGHGSFVIETFNNQLMGWLKNASVGDSL
jgi:FAD/FMN-containing dehydrogenase